MSRDERGTVSVLVIGFFLIVVLLVAVVVDASAAYLRRQGLAALADATALATADGVKAEQVYAGHLDEPAPIDLAIARRHAERYLEQAGAAQKFDGLVLEVGSSAGSVTIRLSTPLDLPIAPPDWADAPVVIAESAALVVVGD